VWIISRYYKTESSRVMFSVTSRLACFVFILASDALIFIPRTERQSWRFISCGMNCIPCTGDASDKIARRDFGLLVASTISSSFFVEKVHAVMMDNPKVKAFEVGKPMDVDDAKTRFKEARQTLNYLIDNYEEIRKGGGDNVRRFLGTVGTTSSMYGISRVLKELQDDSVDIVEYTENMQDFDYYLRAADTAVYSANFVEFSAAKTKPEKFFDDAKSDCVKMIECMEKMAAELKLQ
jgi:hypothetical protein